MLLKLKFRQKLTLVVFLWLAVWPVVHLVWSTFFNLNSWKLGGWGMYARVHAASTGISVFLIEDACQSLTNMEPGQLVGVERVILFRNDETRDLKSDSFGGVVLFERSEVDSLVSYIRVFKRESDIENLINHIKRHLQDPIQIDYALIFLTEPRLDVFKDYTYTDTEIYLVKENEAKKLGTYSTDQYEVEQILALVNSQVELNSCSPL